MRRYRFFCFPKKRVDFKYLEYKFGNRNNYAIGSSLSKGFFFFRVMRWGFRTVEQLEAGRIVYRRRYRSLKKRIKMVFYFFPYVSIHKISIGKRMGKGKGIWRGWHCPMSRGHVLQEFFLYRRKLFGFIMIRNFRRVRKKYSRLVKGTFVFY